MAKRSARCYICPRGQPPDAGCDSNLGTMMPSNILEKILRRGRIERHALISKMKVPALRRHLGLLRNRQTEFTTFSDVAVAFQTFNKGHMTSDVLLPFLRQGCINIVFFADGCADNTLRVASAKLPGKNHFV